MLLTRSHSFESDSASSIDLASGPLHPFPHLFGLCPQMAKAFLRAHFWGGLVEAGGLHHGVEAEIWRPGHTEKTFSNAPPSSAQGMGYIELFYGGSETKKVRLNAACFNHFIKR